MTKFYTSALQVGGRVFYRGYNNGRRVSEKIEYSPTLFVTSKKKTDYKTLFGEYVEPMQFSDIREAKDFVKRYEDVEGFRVYGMTQFQYQFLSDEFKEDIHYDISQMSIVSIDIEVASEDGFPNIAQANEAILLISALDKTTKKNIVWGFKPYNKQDDDTFEYRQYKDEYTLLKEFVMWWHGAMPDIVTGWNVEGFDVPYIINRITRVLGEDWAKKLSPWNMLNSRELTIMNRTSTIWDIVGVVVLDYLDLYKKYTYSSRESYALGFIAKEELGKSKHELEGSFKDQYTNQWDEFVRYNANDTYLVDEMDEKFKFIELTCTIAYLAKCNLRDVFGPVKTWDVFIYNYLKAKNIIIPPQKRSAGGDFEGAWVKEPVPGMYGWTMSFDFASLYPSIIRQWNMSPETFMGMLPGVNVDSFLLGDTEKPEDDLTLAANGAMFRKDIYGIIPEVIKVVIDGRKIAKKEMLSLQQEYNNTKNKHLKGKISSLDGKQMAFKILANSLYGALSNAGFRYYDLRLAEAITLTGQASDRHVEKSLNEYMQKIFKNQRDYVIAGDTDSVYLHVDGIVQKALELGALKDTSVESVVKYLDRLGNDVFQKVINKSIDYVYNVGNCYERIMDMKREAIASKAIWTAKKRYAMMVHNSEGVDYKPYKIKIMGMDLIKSSTPQVIRKRLKDALLVIFEKDQPSLHEYVGNLRSEFDKMPVEDIAFPRSVNDMTKWADPKTIYKLRTPIHVRGALLYNKFKPKSLPELRNGDKVKFIYLKVPNKIKEDIISFPSHGKLPKEMGLHSIIDIDKQWDRVFISPLKGITDAIGWTPEKTATLEEFFG